MMSELQPYRIVYLGMGGIFSALPFKALLTADAEIAAVVLPRPDADDAGPRWVTTSPPPDSSLPLLRPMTPPNLLGLAAEHGVPVLSVGDLHDADSLAAFAELEPDLVITVCFPQLLPADWLTVPRLGCLNLHPSLLPAYRGPSPLFWQFRAGEQATGVTLHFMDQGADQGDIVGQAAVVFPEGISAFEADRLAAEVGGRLILETLALPEIPRRTQPQVGASYQPRPTVADRTIRAADWSAQRAFNFLRGADEWVPFWIETLAGLRLEVRHVVHYQESYRRPQAKDPWVNAVIVEMGAGGVLYVVGV